jgi:Fuc2NAc and GlcNAc transferase
MAATLAFIGWVFLSSKGGSPSKGLLHTCFFAIIMFALGFVDDLSNLSPSFRFLVQLVSALFFLWILVPLFPDIQLGRLTMSGMVWIPVGAVWVVWMVNLYNFMDGIDGLAGGEAAAVSSFFFLVFSYFGEPSWAAANLMVAAASVGFLIYNWPPARIFMGDGGSAFLGAYFGMQCVVAHLTTQVPFPVLILPFSNFILDTTYTLIRRVVRGEKWYQAHRNHIYQRMTNIGMTHKKVTAIELSAVAASCVAAVGYIAMDIYGRIALVAIVIGWFAGAGVYVHRKEFALRAGK